MLENLLQYGKVIEIRDRINEATPEWLEKYGRYQIRVGDRWIKSGNNLVELISLMELELRAATEPIELVITDEMSN